MKNLLLLTTITTLAISSIALSPQAKADSIAQNICQYVAVDDKKRMRSFLKTNKIKLRSIFDSIDCNGKNLLVFAAENNSLETGTFMIGKLSKKVISENLELLKSGAKPLLEVANQRISS